VKRHFGTVVWVTILVVAISAIAGGYLSGEALRPRKMPVAVALPEIAPVAIQRALYGARGLDVPLEPFSPPIDLVVASRPGGWAPEQRPGQREIVRLAIVICGIGEDRTLDQRFAAIPYPLTFAVNAVDRPPAEDLRLDSRALLVDDDPPLSPERVPGALAMLHAGGVLTPLAGPQGKAAPLVQALAGARAFVVDGMADDSGRFYAAAQAQRVPAATRDVVIDAREEEPYINYMLMEAARLARRTGVAIAIGHAYPETYEALRRTLPRLGGAEQVQIVAVGELVTQP